LKRKVFMAVMVGVLLFSMSLGGVAVAKKTFITISTATTAGTYYPMGVAMAQIFNKYLGKYGYVFSAQSSAGSVDNIARMQRKQVEIAILQGKVARWAYNGMFMYKGKAKKWLRAIGALWPNVVHIVVAPGINDIKDLKGKKVVVGRPASGTETSSWIILRSVGLDYHKNKDVITPVYVGYAEAAKLLADRKVDAIIPVGGPPVTAVTQVMAVRKDVKLLGFTPEEAKRIIEEVPDYFEFDIKAGLYPHQSYVVHTIAQTNILGTRVDIPEETIYRVTKTLYTHLKELREAHKAGNFVTLEGATKGVNIPFHKGAIKFYKEAGVWK